MVRIPSSGVNAWTYENASTSFRVALEALAGSRASAIFAVRELLKMFEVSEMFFWGCLPPSHRLLPLPSRSPFPCPDPALSAYAACARRRAAKPHTATPTATPTT